MIKWKISFAEIAGISENNINMNISYQENKECLMKKVYINFFNAIPKHKI